MWLRAVRHSGGTWTEIFIKQFLCIYGSIREGGLRGLGRVRTEYRVYIYDLCI